MVCLKDLCCIHIFANLNSVGPPIRCSISKISGQWSKTGMGRPLGCCNQSVATKTLSLLLHEAFSPKSDHVCDMFNKGRSIRENSDTQSWKLLVRQLILELPFLFDENSISLKSSPTHHGPSTRLGSSSSIQSSDSPE